MMGDPRVSEITLSLCCKVGGLNGRAVVCGGPRPEKPAGAAASVDTSEMSAETTAGQKKKGELPDNAQTAIDSGQTQDRNKTVNQRSRNRNRFGSSRIPFVCYGNIPTRRSGDQQGNEGGGESGGDRRLFVYLACLLCCVDCT